MRLAERMSQLGTETAFDVLARAKQLEAQGKPIIHLEIGEPDFDTPSTLLTPPLMRSTRAGPTTAPAPAIRNLGRLLPSIFRKAAASP